jgi:prepilin-type N-terminal cleavage/methylation domain-containing protein/prepilin-type processing-associated H-X9-DG protein
MPYTNGMKGGQQYGSSPEARLFSVGPVVSRPEAAFSLLEMLITVALILILTTMYWGGSSADRQKAQRANCRKNLQTLYISMDIYATEHGGKYPVVTGARTSEEALDPLVPRYTADTSIFICPASKDSSLASGEPIAKRRISYAYYMGRRPGDAQEVLMTDRQVDALSKTNGQLMFSDSGKAPGNNHRKAGGSLLFCDGHAESSPVLAPFSIVLTQGIVLLNPKR